MTDSYDSLSIERLGRVVRITLDRPERRNAISRASQAELIAAVDACAKDPEAHAVIIRAAGPSFCAGYDIAGGEGEAGGEASTPRKAMEMLEITRGWTRIWDAPIPIVAQVHGHCLAGGTDLATSCDIVIVAEDAVIGFPALRMGGTPPMNMWLYNVGPQWAKRLLYSGDTFTGRLAAQIGFALEAVPAAELEQRALALATRFAAMGRDIVAINKHVLNKGLDLMGRALLQEFTGPMDVIANQAPEMAAFIARAAEIGLAAAFKERDAPFADGLPLDVPPRST
jgi:enoyl-CoA hydratase